MTAHFIKTGLIGHPVSHSKSPLIHNYWIQKYGLSGTYTAIDLSCENLEAGIANLVAEGFGGFNVTVPHKVDVMSFCHTLDPLAKIVGAVNTVVVQNGKLHGTNTDVYGFVENIKENTPPHFSFSGGAALVLGAGGAARAVVQGLIEAGAPEILIANRTRANADLLLSTISQPEKIKIIDWSERQSQKTLANINFLVNTTALGMSGKAPLEMDLTHLPLSALVHDIVYAPLLTALLQNAKNRGNPIATGIGMLLHQARPAFHRWYGVMPEVDRKLTDMVLA